jgi:osmotically-inducible protein OsmY
VPPWNASLPPDHVMVQVGNGWVTLSGEVTHDH